MKYMIISAVSIESLDKEVNLAILEGWVPQGGMAWGGSWNVPEFLGSREVNSYLQAMVKEAS